ncbi:DUF1376 domain-containing protein [Prosthecobacter sp.]|uniref:DUF1376 domain-containing protein n=1 Tax=Prosthecobacter sp. TaxID=1965333 RepID=UPI00378430A3
MHIIPLNIGDFTQATQRFKPVHLGIFLTLLMEYYKSETPLTDDRDELAFLAGASSPAERSALDLVLKYCFVHDAERKIFIQKRVEKEIAAFKVTGQQKRYAILCRHWDSVNGTLKRPTFEAFALDPSRYYEDATGRIRVLDTRKPLVLQPYDSSSPGVPPPNYPTETSNQKPETSNHESTAAGAVVTPVAAEKPSPRQPSDDALAEEIYMLYPRKKGKLKALAAIKKAIKTSGLTEMELQAKVRLYAESVKDEDPQFIPYPATWFNAGHHLDDPAGWKRTENAHVQHEHPPTKKEIGAEEIVIEEKDLLSGAGDFEQGLARRLAADHPRADASRLRRRAQGLRSA